MKVKASHSVKFRKSRVARLQGIGIDLVSLDRIRRFIKDHGKQAARRLLSRTEFVQWSQSRNAALGLAKWFAAKEAFFKAVNGTWLGVEGFRSIEIRWQSANRFQGKIRTAKGLIHQADGSVFASPEWVGAQVLDWK